MQYRVLHPSEVGQSGKMLKAQQAASRVVTMLDREMFWKVCRHQSPDPHTQLSRHRFLRIGVAITRAHTLNPCPPWKVSVAEIEEMRRRGMPADAVRVREPLVKKMREQRLKVARPIVAIFPTEQWPFTHSTSSAKSWPLIHRIVTICHNFQPRKNRQRLVHTLKPAPWIFLNPSTDRMRIDRASTALAKIESQTRNRMVGTTFGGARRPGVKNSKPEPGPKPQTR